MTRRATATGRSRCVSDTQIPPKTGSSLPGVAATGRDRPVTSVTRVTAGTSAHRSTATVLADDLVEELAGLRDPGGAAAAAGQDVGPGAPQGVGPAPGVVEPGAAGEANAPGLPLTPRSPGAERPAADDAVAEPSATDATEAPEPPAATPPPADAPGPGRRPRRRDRRGPSLREQRRLRTREAIVDAAAELFIERGFDQVSVMEIAQRAGVVEKTVFNHFPVKEGLVFQADPPIRAALVDAVRRRPVGESVAAAAGTFVVAPDSRLGSAAGARGVAGLARVTRRTRTPGP